MADVYEPGICPLCGGRNGVHVWAGTGGCPAVTGNPFEQQLKQKDAIIAAQKIHCEGQSVQIERLKAIIPELCDALESKVCFGFEYNDLIERAREETR
jgi:hypothetical protein